MAAAPNTALPTAAIQTRWDSASGLMFDREYQRFAQPS